MFYQKPPTVFPVQWIPNNWGDSAALAEIANQGICVVSNGRSRFTTHVKGNHQRVWTPAYNEYWLAVITPMKDLSQPTHFFNTRNNKKCLKPPTRIRTSWEAMGLYPSLSHPKVRDQWIKYNRWRARTMQGVTIINANMCQTPNEGRHGPQRSLAFSMAQQKVTHEHLQNGSKWTVTICFMFACANQEIRINQDSHCSF